jgi:hypothetical protein
MNPLLNNLLLAWLIANLEPLQDFLAMYIKPYIKIEYLRNALSCFKCLGFWLTLATTYDIYLASGAALIAYVFDKIMNSIPMRF